MGFQRNGPDRAPSRVEGARAMTGRKQRSPDAPLGISAHGQEDLLEWLYALRDHQRATSSKGTWLIKAKEPGRTEVVLKYYRVWEGPDKAEDQFSIILNIK